jgi:hypothetical protein
MTRLRAVLLLLSLGAAALMVRSLQAGSVWGFAGGNAEVPEVAGPAAPFDRDVESVRILVGLKDAQPEAWEGRIAVSGGALVRLRGHHLEVGDWVSTDSWSLTSRPDMGDAGWQRGRTGGGIPDEEEPEGAGDLEPAVAIEKGIVADIRGGEGARIEVRTPEGGFQVALQEMRRGRPRRMLGGAVAVERLPAHAQVTRDPGDEDFPSVCVAPDGAVWAAFVAYERGTPVRQEEIRSGRFDSLVTRGNGDQVRLMKFSGTEWSAPINVTDRGLDVWRPTVAVDRRGGVWVVWSQGVQGNWDLYGRRYDPGTNRLGRVRRLTRDPGADIHPALATGIRGEIWIAWQGWRGDNFDIWLAPLDDGMLEPQQVSASAANDWHPALAAGGNGDLWIAWDTYDRGNYDVLVRKLSSGGLEPPVPVAASPRFEARPSLALDGQQRVWVAFEDAAPNWGKDYGTRWEGRSGEQFYLERFIKVRCLSEGRVHETQATVPFEATNTTYPPGPRVRVSFPRLAVDGQGRPWLLYRRHPLRTGQGERWISLATYYNGNRWSPQVPLPESQNLLDNRPAPAAVKDGLLVLYSGDGRTGGQQTAKENNLFSTLIAAEGTAQAPALAAVDPAQGAGDGAPVHPDEGEDIQRMRAYRGEAGGKTYQLLRGEFHRHTEMSSHRDQDGPFEEIWRYGLDVARMDWIGPGDHDSGLGHEYTWWLTQKQCAIYFHAPTFLPLFTYERSVPFPSGHRNVMFAERGIRPLPRLSQGMGGGQGMGGMARNPLLFGTPEQGSPDIKNLYAYLKRFDGICASHTSATNMGTDWRDNDPEVEPVVEIYQGHRQNYEEPNAPKAAKNAMDSIGGYQPAGYVWNAFGKGYRLGFQTSSDHISTHLSYAIVFAENTSREAVLDAFKKRHSYGANDNILLDVRCGGHMMGDQFTQKSLPKLQISADGTAPIARVDIVRQVGRAMPAYVYAAKPGGARVRMEWTDIAAQAGEVNMYYVRIMQEDGKLAWASPLWVRYQP